jgi:Spy/CpxP family protein refolding chaperone
MKFWLLASFLCVFAAGAATSFLAVRLLGGGSADRPDLSLRQIYPDPPYVIASERIYDELDLDAKQRAALADLFSRHYQRVRDVRESLLELQTDLMRGVHAILEPEQVELFAEIQKRYGEREIQGRVEHELVDLVRELDLLPEQEPLVYMILYDAAIEGRRVWEDGRKSREGRDALRRRFEDLFARRDAEIRQVLTLEQDVKFAELRERQRSMMPDRRGGPKERDAGKDPGRKEPAREPGKEPRMDPGMAPPPPRPPSSPPLEKPLDPGGDEEGGVR